jgi:rare lipoprotein A
MVRVTNLENGRSIILRVNDRGPFVNGRIVDVSRRAAQLLGFEVQGTAKVRVSVIQAASRRYVSGKPVTTDEERNAVAAVPRIEVSGEALPPPKGIPVAPAPPQSTPPIVSLEPVSKTEVFIQAGAFTAYENAKRLHDELRAIGPTRVSTVTIQGQTFHRVRLGPMTTVEQADIVLAKVVDSGYVDARIIVD